MFAKISQNQENVFVASIFGIRFVDTCTNNPNYIYATKISRELSVCHKINFIISISLQPNDEYF